MALVLPCECVTRKRIPSSAIINRWRVSRVTKGAPVTDVKASRARIAADMVRMRRHLMVEGQRALSRTLRSYFTQKLNEVCDRVLKLARERGYKSIDTKESEELHFGANESLWREAIEQVLGPNTSIELMGQYVPAIQSIAAKANSRTSLLIGEDVHPQAANNIHKRAYNLARQVMKINETTRKQLERRVVSAVADGSTIKQTVDSIRDAIPEISAARVPTIARTEVGRAIDEGTKQAILDSSSVTLVDVVGCQAVEPNCPEFDGRPTCNITGVPADRVDELEFHPNHTGCIIPSGFVTE